MFLSSGILRPGWDKGGSWALTSPQGLHDYRCTCGSSQGPVSPVASPTGESGVRSVPTRPLRRSAVTGREVPGASRRLSYGTVASRPRRRVYPGVSDSGSADRVE